MMLLFRSGLLKPGDELLAVNDNKIQATSSNADISEWISESEEVKLVVKKVSGG